MPPRSSDRPGPKQKTIIVLGMGVLVAASCGFWLFGGWGGFAATSILLTIATATVAVLQRARTLQSLSDLESLVTGLGQADNVNLDAYRLEHRWKEAAKRFVDSYNSLSSLLRERQSAAQKLEFSQRLAQAAQRRAEAIVDSLGDAVLVTNSFGELQLANPEAQRLFRFELDKALGKPVRQVIQHLALASMIEQVGQRGAGNQRHSEEISFVCDEKPRWYKVAIGPVVDSSTEHLGIAAVVRDITSEKAAQARSAEFVSAVSHEIKTPLASVKAYAEMLADGDVSGDPDTQQKFLEIIETQTDRMTRLLESMLDMARIESGVVRVDKRIVSLNDLIENGAKLMAPAAADKNIKVETQFSSLYLGVSVDPDMMSRVVMNLVSNAIKYTDRDGRIILRSQIIEDQAIFEVEDTGCGIPAEAMPKLFQKFYRVKENANVAPGTGLGLSLVKHIVEEVHGGRIEVESQVGQGSIFRVKLPVESLN